jgi:hypothetical protein
MFLYRDKYLVFLYDNFYPEIEKLNLSLSENYFLHKFNNKVVKIINKYESIFIELYEYIINNETIFNKYSPDINKNTLLNLIISSKEIMLELLDNKNDKLRGLEELMYFILNNSGLQNELLNYIMTIYQTENVNINFIPSIKNFDDKEWDKLDLENISLLFVRNGFFDKLSLVLKDIIDDIKSLPPSIMNKIYFVIYLFFNLSDKKLRGFFNLSIKVIDNKKLILDNIIIKLLEVLQSKMIMKD